MKKFISNFIKNHQEITSQPQDSDMQLVVSLNKLLDDAHAVLGSCNIDIVNHQGTAKLVTPSGDSIEFVYEKDKWNRTYDSYSCSESKPELTTIMTSLNQYLDDHKLRLQSIEKNTTYSDITVRAVDLFNQDRKIKWCSSQRVWKE